MAGVIECKDCGFDLSSLPGVLRIAPMDGAEKNLTCPLCGHSVMLRIPSLGILVRGTGQNTTFARWKLSAKDDGSLLKVGKLTLRLENLGVIEPKEVCYPRVPVFVDENGTLVVPTIPIRDEFFDCVDEVALRAKMATGAVGAIVGSTYQLELPLKGMKEPAKLTLQLLTPEAGAPSKTNAFRDLNVRVWPNLDLKDWRYYLVGVAGTNESGDRFIKERRLRAKTRSSSGDNTWTPVDTAQRDGGSLCCLLRERPAWLAVEIVDPSRGNNGVMAGGVFVIPEARSDSAPNTQAVMGLDFGTSNTCVAVSDFMTRHNGPPELLPKIEETAWNLYLVRGGAENSSPKGPDLWPSCKGFGRYGDLIPSELTFFKPKRDLATDLERLQDWKFGIHYGIPSAGVAPQFVESDYTIGDFKWAGMLRRSLPFIASKTQALQTQYLTAVLLSAYARAAIASSQMAKGVNVRCSYPMAFVGADKQTLSDALAAAALALDDYTGVNWQLELAADESSSAAANAAGVDADVFVYLDMGGGSTDIAVRMSTGGSKSETIYCTSVNYAGSALLAGYAGTVDPRTGKPVNSCLTTQTTLDVLRRRVREANHADEVISDPTLFNNSAKVVVERRTRHFYTYVNEYAARLLAAGFLDQRFKTGTGADRKFPAELKIAFFFLGNGWGFAARSKDNMAQLQANLIFDRMFELVTGEKERSPYATAIVSELEQAETNVNWQVGYLREVPHSKAAVALGVLKVDQAHTEKSPVSSAILGWTTTVGDREIPWFVRYGSGRPQSANSSTTGAAGGGSIKFGTKAPVAQGPQTPWYGDPLPEDARVDWPKTPPELPDGIAHPYDLDENLNGTRVALRQRCSVKNRWFETGPYEVLLEELFKSKLAEIA